MEIQAIKWFGEIHSDDINLVGGKGLSLGRMVDAALQVPDGFVISTDAYRAYVRHNMIDGRAEEITAGFDQGDLDQIQSAAEELQKLYIKGDIPEAILDNVRSAYAQLAGTDGAYVAVRSSATAEDLAGASFAGQYDSYLNIRDWPGLLDAVKKCWSSLWTARAISYRRKQNIANRSVQMAVIVQRMVPADVSGIVFTANPLTGDRSEIVINSSWGLGESIVSGEIDPDTIVVDKETGRIKQFDMGQKAVTTLTQPGGMVEVDTNATEVSKASIGQTEISGLRHMARQVENIFGTHVDIEWAIHSGRLSILQARPITVLPPQPLVWTAPGPGLWVHGGGIMEFQIEPISPMTSSLIEDIFTSLYGEMAPFIRTAATWPPVQVINGHLYSCLTYKIRPWHIPRVAKLIVQHLKSPSQWQAELMAYNAEIERLTGLNLRALTAAELVSCLESVLRAFFRYYFQYASMVQVLTDAEVSFTRYYTRSVKTESDPEAAFFLQGQETRITAAENAICALANEVRAAPALAAVLDSASPQVIQEKLSMTKEGEAFLQHVRCYIDTYGYQMYAFDFNVPTLGERLDLVYGAISTAAKGQDDLRARQRKVREEQSRVLEKFRRRLSRKKWQRFEKLLDKARHDLGKKENAVFAIGKGIPVARSYFLEIGRRLAEKGVLAGANDIFWLTWSQVLDTVPVLDKNLPVETLVPVVAERREQWKRYEGVDAPTFLPADSKPGWWVSLVMPIPELDEQTDSNQLIGTSISPGTITGVARVITSIDDMRRLQRGEILVTDATTPAWTPFFGHIGGLVTNRGGKLTHSSIVAREYGIPVVMGTASATKHIVDGQQITVDGNRGIVLLA